MIEQMFDGEIENVLDECKDVHKVKNVKVHNILVWEIKVLLDIGSNPFYPELQIKVYKSVLQSDEPFYCELSHFVKTPNHMMPYRDIAGILKRAKSPVKAVKNSISLTAQELKSGGHDPKDDWMVKNDKF